MFSKSIRIFVVGASFLGFIYFALSLSYQVWAIQIYSDTTRSSVTDTFGLWEKCQVTQNRPKNGTVQPTNKICEKFGSKKSLLGIKGTPGFIHATRAIVIASTITLFIVFVVALVIMIISDRPLFLCTFPLLLTTSILGGVVIGIFVGFVENKSGYDNYTMGWTFYYYLIGWFFSLGALGSSLKDRNCPTDHK